MYKNLIYFFLIVLVVCGVIIGINQGFTPTKKCGECPKYSPIPNCSSGEELVNEVYRVEGYCFNTCKRPVCKKFD